MISDIMHIVAHDNGKLAERWGRKTTGLRDDSYDSGATEVSRDSKFRIMRISGRGHRPSDSATCTNSMRSTQTHLGRTE